MVELLEADTSTLIFSTCPEEVYAPRLLRSGADGFLPQTANGETIVEAVRTVADGRTYVSSELAQIITERWRGGTERDLDCLSNREFQVIRLVAAGKSIENIAERLCVSGATVSTYKRRIRDKLGIDNDVEMAWYAWSRDLVEHPS
jgi:DNA-binding NarL/FixJ family response regulator